MNKIYIEIEGTDCSGKQTISTILEDTLRTDYNIKAKKISFPRYDNESSTNVKKYLNGEFGQINDLSPYEISKFYIEDRLISYKNEWEAFTKENDIIIFDRYVDSNVLYQLPKFKTIEEKKEFMNWCYNEEYVKNKIPIPTHIFLLKTPLEFSFELNKKRANKFTGENVKDIHESNKKYIEEVYNNCSEFIKIGKNVNVIETSFKDEDGYHFYPSKDTVKNIINKILK